MTAAIDVQHLTRSYGRQRGIIDLTFSVQEGEILGVLGPNGAGKTTTIRILMGMLRPGQGTAQVLGRNCWSDSARVKRSVGFLPGDVRWNESWTGAEALDYFSDLRPTSNPEMRRHLIERFALDPHPKIKHLSKGNRQKLAIIQAFMHDAPILILDEPSSGLDPLMQVELLQLLHEERDRGKTIFISTHILSEVERIANRVAIIREGRQIALDDVEHLRGRRERRMEVVLSATTDLSSLRGLNGVRIVSVDDDGRHLALAVQGSLPPLLAVLAEMPVVDLTYGPPDLENVFLHYYDHTVGEGKPSTATEAPADDRHYYSS